MEITLAKYKQIPAQFTLETIAILDEIAFEEARRTHTRPSRADIIRTAVDEYLEKHKK